MIILGILTGIYLLGFFGMIIFMTPGMDWRSKLGIGVCWPYLLWVLSHWKE